MMKIAVLLIMATMLVVASDAASVIGLRTVFAGTQSAQITLDNPHLLGIASDQPYYRHASKFQVTLDVVESRPECGQTVARMEIIKQETTQHTGTARTAVDQEFMMSSMPSEFYVVFNQTGLIDHVLVPSRDVGTMINYAKRIAALFSINWQAQHDMLHPEVDTHGEHAARYEPSASGATRRSRSLDQHPEVAKAHTSVHESVRRHVAWNHITEATMGENELPGIVSVMESGIVPFVTHDKVMPADIAVEDLHLSDDLLKMSRESEIKLVATSTRPSKAYQFYSSRVLQAQKNQGGFIDATKQCINSIIPENLRVDSLLVNVDVNQNPQSSAEAPSTELLAFVKELTSSYHDSASLAKRVAFVQRYPSVIPILFNRFVVSSAEDNELRLAVLGLFGLAGGAEAERHLLKCLHGECGALVDDKDQPTQFEWNVVFAMSNLPNPSSQILDAIVAVMSQPNRRALLPLYGIILRHYAATDSVDAAVRVSDLLDIEALCSDDWDCISAHLTALGNAAHQDALPAIEKHLNHASHAVASAAVLALRLFGHSNVENTLLDVITNPSLHHETVRAAAVDALNDRIITRAGVARLVAHESTVEEDPHVKVIERVAHLLDAYNVQRDEDTSHKARNAIKRRNEADLVAREQSVHPDRSGQRRRFISGAPVYENSIGFPNSWSQTGGTPDVGSNIYLTSDNTAKFNVLGQQELSVQTLVAGSSRSVGTLYGSNYALSAGSISVNSAINQQLDFAAGTAAVTVNRFTCASWAASEPTTQPWIAALPQCPCVLTADTAGNAVTPLGALWISSYPSSTMLHTYKPSADACFSSVATNGGPSQQCCYSKQQSVYTLITSGTGAGTVWRNSPTSGGARTAYLNDLAPLIACTRAGSMSTFWNLRPINAPASCASLELPLGSAGGVAATSTAGLRNINPEGQTFVMAFEGFRPYPTAGFTKGNQMLIGYGHIVANNEVFPPVVTMDQAEFLLLHDLSLVSMCVEAVVQRPLSDTQYAAMLSFAESTSCNVFATSSVLNAINGNRYQDVPNALQSYTAVTIDGSALQSQLLVNRRSGEGELFTRGVPLATDATMSSSLAYFKVATNVIYNAPVLSNMVSASTATNTLQSRYFFQQTYPRTATAFFGTQAVTMSFSDSTFNFNINGNGFFDGQLTVEILPLTQQMSASAQAGAYLTVYGTSTYSGDTERGTLTMTADVCQSAPVGAVSLDLDNFPLNACHYDRVVAQAFNTVLDITGAFKTPSCRSCGKGCTNCVWNWGADELFHIWSIQLPAGTQMVLNTCQTVAESAGPFPAFVYDGSPLIEQDSSQNVKAVICAWNPFTTYTSRLVNYEVGVGTSAQSPNLAAFRSVGLAQVGTISLALNAGTRYYCVVRGTTMGGQQAVASSNGFVPDNTPPLPGFVSDGLNNVDKTWTSERNSFLGSWTMSDPESGSIYAQVALGRQPYASDLVTWLDIGVSSFYSLWSTTTLNQGEMAYFGVRGVNKAGLMSEQWSNGITVDLTAPVLPRPGLVIASAVPSNSTPVYQTSQSSITASFAGLNDPESGVATYSLYCGLSAGDSTSAVCNALNVAFDRNTPTYQFTGLNLVPQLQYFCWLLSYNTAGGLAFSVSPGVIIDVDIPVVSKVLDGQSTTDIQYQASATQACMSWSATDGTSGISLVMWSVGTTPGATNVLNWGATATASTAGTDCRTATLPENVLLYTNVYVKDGAQHSSPVKTSNGVIVDTSPPTSGSVIDGCSGTGVDATYQADPSRACATLFTFADPQSGVAGYYIAFGYSIAGTEILSWTWVDGLHPYIATSLNLTPGRRIYASVRVCNGAGGCTAANSDGFLCAPFPPVAGVVSDGSVAGTDISYTSTNTQVCGTWTAFSEPISGVTYVVGAGSQPWLTDLAPAVSVGTNLQYCFTGLNIVNGITAYIVVTATSGADLATTAASNGVVVDITPPLAGLINDGPSADVEYVASRAQASWSVNGAASLDDGGDANPIPPTPLTPLMVHMINDLVLMVPNDPTIVLRGDDCGDVLRRSGGVAASATYVVQGNAPVATEVYCNMALAGGGLELLAVLTDADSVSWGSSTAWGYGPSFGFQDAGLQNDYRSLAYSIRKYQEFAIADSSSYLVSSMFGCIRNSTVQDILGQAILGGAAAGTQNSKCYVSSSSTPPYLKNPYDGTTQISGGTIAFYQVAADGKTAIPIAGTKPGGVSSGLGTILLGGATGYSTDVGNMAICNSNAAQCAAVYPQRVYIYGVIGRTDALQGPSWRDGGGDVNFIGFQDPESPLVDYQACLGTGPYLCDTSPRIDVQLTPYVTFSNVTMTSGVRYTTTVWAKNAASLTNSSYTNGFVYDPNVPAAKRVVDGTNIAQDAQYQASNTQLSACFDQFSSISGMASYQIGWGLFPGQDTTFTFQTVTDVTSPTVCVTRTATSTLAQLSVYYFTVRGFTQAGLMTEARSDGVMVDKTAPVARYVYDGNLAADAAYLTTAPVACRWQFLEDSPSVITYEVQMLKLDGTIVVDWFSVGTVRAWTFVTTTVVDGVSYKFSVRATNQAGLQTTLTSNGFLFDSTPPIAGQLYFVGPSVETRVPNYVFSNAVKFINSSSTFCFAYPGFSDPDSTLTTLQLSYIVVAPTATSGTWVTSAVLTNGAPFTYCVPGLSMADGSSVSVSVKATNAALLSTTVSSNAAVVATVGPVIGAAARDGMTLVDLQYISCGQTTQCANWDAFTSNGRGAGPVIYYTTRMLSSGWKVVNTTFSCIPNVVLTPGVLSKVDIVGYTVAGLTAAMSTNGVICDATPPTAGTVTSQCNKVLSGEDALRQAAWTQSGYVSPPLYPGLTYISSVDDLCFQWTGFAETNIPNVLTYQFGISSTNTGPADILPLQNNGGATSIVSTSLAAALNSTQDVFYGLVVATNLAGLSSQASSSPILEDTAGAYIGSITIVTPDGTPIPSAAQTYTNQLCVNVSGLVPEGPSGIQGVVLAAYQSDTMQRLSDYVPVNPVLFNQSSFVICIQSSNNLPPLQETMSYFVTAYCKTNAGVDTVFSSGSVLIDLTPPTPGTVSLIVVNQRLGTTELDPPYLAYDPNTGACATWNGIVDDGSGLASVAINLLLANMTLLSSYPAGSLGSDGLHCFTEISLDNDQTYLFQTVVFDQAGLSSTVDSVTFTVDTTLPLVTNIVVALGQPVVAGIVTVTFTPIDDESGVTTCYYGVTSLPGGSANVIPEASVPCSSNVPVSVTIDTTPVADGTSCYVMITADSGSGLIGTYDSSRLLIDNSGPVPSTVYHTLTCGINDLRTRFTSVVNATIACWLGFSDPDSSVSYEITVVKADDSNTEPLALPDSPTYLFNFESVGNLSGSGLTFSFPDDAMLLDTESYLTCIIGLNGAGVRGDASCTLSYLVDLSPPTAGIVYGGVNSTIFTQSTTDAFAVHWTGFDDPQSGFNNNGSISWRVACSPDEDINNVNDSLWIDVGALRDLPRYQWYNLNLTDNTLYYGHVCATNAAQLTTCAVSNGVMVNTSLITPFYYAPAPPVFSAGDGNNDYPYTANDTAVFYELFYCIDTVSLCAFCTACVSSSADGNCGFLEMTNLGLLDTLTLTGLQLQQNVRYWNNVTCCNHGNSCSNMLTPGALVDVTLAETPVPRLLPIAPFIDAPPCDVCGTSLLPSGATADDVPRLWLKDPTFTIVYIDPRDNETGIINTTIALLNLDLQYRVPPALGIRYADEPLITSPNVTSNFSLIITNPVNQSNTFYVEYTAVNGARQLVTSDVQLIQTDLTAPPPPYVFISDLNAPNISAKSVDVYSPQNENVTVYYILKEDPDRTPLVDVVYRIVQVNRTSHLPLPGTEQDWISAGTSGSFVHVFNPPAENGYGWKFEIRTINAAWLASNSSFTELYVVDVTAPLLSDVHEGPSDTDVDYIFGDLWCRGAVYGDNETRVKSWVIVSESVEGQTNVTSYPVTPDPVTGLVILRIPPASILPDHYYYCGLLVMNQANLTSLKVSNGAFYQPSTVVITPDQNNTVDSLQLSLSFPDYVPSPWVSMDVTIPLGGIVAGPTSFNLGFNSPSTSPAGRRDTEFVAGYPNTMVFEEKIGDVLFMWFLGNNLYGNDSADYTLFTNDSPLTYMISTGDTVILPIENTTVVQMLWWNATAGAWTNQTCGEAGYSWDPEHDDTHWPFAACSSGYFALWQYNPKPEASQINATAIGVGVAVAVVCIIVVLLLILGYSRYKQSPKVYSRRASELSSQLSLVSPKVDMSKGIFYLQNDTDNTESTPDAFYLQLHDMSTLQDESKDSEYEDDGAEVVAEGAESYLVFKNQAYAWETADFGEEGVAGQRTSAIIRNARPLSQMSRKGTRSSGPISAEDSANLAAAIAASRPTSKIAAPVEEPVQEEPTDDERWHAIGLALSDAVNIFTDELVLDAQIMQYKDEKERAHAVVENSAFGRAEQAMSNKTGDFLSRCDELAHVGKDCMKLCPDPVLAKALNTHVVHLQNAVAAFSIVRNRITDQEAQVFRNQFKKISGSLIETCLSASLVYEQQVAALGTDHANWRKTVRLKAGGKRRAAMKRPVSTYDADYETIDVESNSQSYANPQSTAGRSRGDYDELDQYEFVGTNRPLSEVRHTAASADPVPFINTADVQYTQIQTPKANPDYDNRDSDLVSATLDSHQYVNPSYSNASRENPDYANMDPTHETQSSNGYDQFAATHSAAGYDYLPPALEDVHDAHDDDLEAGNRASAYSRLSVVNPTSSETPLYDAFAPESKHEYSLGGAQTLNWDTASAQDEDASIHYGNAAPASNVNADYSVMHDYANEQDYAPELTEPSHYGNQASASNEEWADSGSGLMSLQPSVPAPHEDGHAQAALEELDDILGGF